MKVLFTLFLILHITVFAQSKTKKVLVESEGLPILMLTGGTADNSVFTPHAKQLSSANKIIRMEHFNVQYATEGRTLPKNYSVQMESRAIKTTLDSLNIREPVVLVGHSYGGLIALDFAINHPDYIRSLVLIEPPVFAIAKANKIQSDGMKEMQNLLKKLTTGANVSEDHVKKFRCSLMNCDSLDIRQHPMWTTWIMQKNRLRGLSVINHYKLNLNKLHRFQKPVLIITGTQTVPYHKKIDELLTAAFPLAFNRYIQGGHLAVNTNVSEFVNLLKDFLNRKD